MPDPATFEHYEVLTRDDGSLYELGRGAMGVTYKAFDTNLRMPVALKVITAAYLNNEVARQRFVREARSAAKLRHRNVATVYHLGTAGETWFYAMEFIDGETVDALIKRHGPLEPAMALRIAEQVARALNAAVPHALVHRDLKPANLMIVREDDELVVKVIDFGLAKSSLPGESEEEAVTLSMGGFVGTPHFASPEQLDEKEIDVRSDIYSLGVTLWYMLAGKTPFAGSMAQVMSQHLSKLPPFEQFAGLPEPVAALLRKMLEKDPAARPQTPQELRRAIEECLAQISGSSPAAAGVEDDQNFATMLEEVQQRPGGTPLECGAIIAGRYRIAEALGETNSGRVFRAYDRERQRDVRLLVLNPDLISDPAAYTQVEREIEKIEPVHQPNLLEIFAFETVAGASFLVLEWTDGFSMLELLRVRRELEADEALLLLRQAATGADQALAAGLKRVDFGLHQILLHFAQQMEKEKLLRQPIASWPPFTLKLNPLGITRELSASETWAGGQTMVQGVAGGGEATDIRARYVQALGAVTYELLGGTLSPVLLAGTVSGLAARYTPLSTLSEEGNEVLKRALDPVQSFPSAGEFCTALQEIEVLEVQQPEALFVDRSTTGSPPALPRAAAPGQVPGGPAAKPKIPLKFLSGLLTALLLGGGVYFLAPPHPPKTDEPAPTAAVSSSDDGPPITPVNADTPPLTVTSEPMPTPEPTPVRENQIREAVAAAEAIEKEGDPARSIEAWLKIAREFPESETPRRRLDFVIDPLRKLPELKKPEVFDTLKPLVVEAAQLDVVSAMLLLGQNLREREDEPAQREAFNWYAAASEKGVGEALTQVALMLSNGRGTPREPRKSVYYFEQAAEQGEVDAKAALAECYLLGKGTEQNIQRGRELLKEAADKGSLRAMNRLGDYYHRGDNGLPLDYGEALNLFTKVTDTKDLTPETRKPVAEAWGNLGVLYMMGHGPRQDATKAAQYFEKGARLGDAASMRNLARCFQEGIAKTRSMDDARIWYKKAAEAGDRLALDWCRQNGVTVNSL